MRWMLLVVLASQMYTGLHLFCIDTTPEGKKVSLLASASQRQCPNRCYFLCHFSGTLCM